jgi:hypothetical protein
MRTARAGIFAASLTLIAACLFAGGRGESWKQVAQCTYAGQTLVAGFLNESFGVSVGSWGDVFRTVDGGKSWERGQNKSRWLWALDIWDERSIFCCGTGGSLGATHDGGTSWQPLGYPVEIKKVHAMFLRTANDGYSHAIPSLSTTVCPRWRPFISPMPSTGRLSRSLPSRKGPGDLLKPRTAGRPGPRAISMLVSVPSISPVTASI